ncbi:unnamed protein product [Paramecium octaurelia]|uniref:Uncharacterized protein n=1 Tax=Paramecium octaurelia TaxID=43137 RepID=A0A8S1XGB4_PAROT|nr:unnamed protein product [Paramecium octaurelia]CAD8199935.1 unnamed protein product [Paramecium octaurelia]
MEIFFPRFKDRIFGDQFHTFSNFRRISYITIIVELIRQPQAQTFLLYMQSVFYLQHLIYFRPLKSYIDLIKLCRQGLFSIITGSFQFTFQNQVRIN